MKKEEKEQIKTTLLQEEEFEEKGEEEVEEEVVEREFRDRKIITYPIDFTVGNLMDEMINNKNILLDEDYQRHFLWDNSTASKLIESLFIGVPIPVCYFAEFADGKYSVVDGKQRLGSIEKFGTNDLKLSGLKILKELNGLKWKDLNEDQRRRIKSRTIRCIVILKESDPNTKYEVFERLNMESHPLNKQELRNAIYRGNLNNLLKELAKNPQFKYTRNVTEEDRRMNDRELILRFFAFHEQLHLYKPSFAGFLDTYLEDGMKSSTEKITRLRTLFLRVIDDVKFVFDNMAFREFDNEKQSWGKVNRAIYDVVMLSFAKLNSEDIRSKKEEIIEKFKELCTDKDFSDSVTTWTKQPNAIKTRLNLWRDKLKKLGLELPEFKVEQLSKKDKNVEVIEI